MSDAGRSAPRDDDAPPPRSGAEQARMEEAIRELFEERIVFNGFLGFRIESRGEDRVRIGFPMRDELVGHFLHGRLHGGVISSVLDATGGLAVMWSIAARHAHEDVAVIMGRFRHLGTVDLRVDYLRQGIGERFVATAETVRLGRRIAATAMRLENEAGTLIATGNATYIVE